MLAAAVTHADPPCRTVQVMMQPSPHLQIAVWIEDDGGNFLDTVYLTRATGALGLANRPGNAMFKSAYRWPYGRRDMVLPVWAHHRNHSYGYVVMGGAGGIDDDDNSIGYHESYSSTEPFYCPPSGLALDATSCASPFVGSKGIYLGGQSSLYPPRADLTTFEPEDSDDARHFAAVNDLAAISGATPPGGQLITPPLSWVAPSSLPNGLYHVLVEASLEADFNSANQHASFPDVNSELRSFGRDAIGQPSVVYSVPVTVDGGVHIATSDGWLGYGAWDGSTGDLHAADSTISDAPGTGAGRLAHVTDSDGTWRVKAVSGGCQGCTTPMPSGALTAKPADTSITISFTAPAAATSGALGAARAYDIRYRPDMPLDDAGFSDGIPADTPPLPATPGTTQTVTLTGLKAQTLYYVGVRTVNACGGFSTANFASATTTQQQFVTLHGCFVATAAYGSPMEPDVALVAPLSRSRASYVTARAIGGGDLLRAQPAARRRHRERRASARTGAARAGPGGDACAGVAFGQGCCAMKRLVSALLLALAMAPAGCARVRPYQREYLSQRPMDPASEATEDRFRQHWQDSREGSTGGFGAAGGGCGCN